MDFSWSDDFRGHKVGYGTSDNSVVSPLIYVHIRISKIVTCVEKGKYQITFHKITLDSHYKQLNSTMFQRQFTAFDKLKQTLNPFL